jgi:hypothetical protein
VQANDWPFSGVGFDGQHVETAAGGIDAPGTQELAGHAGEVASLVGVDGVFGSGLGVRRRTGFYFHEGQGAAVVADEIDFTFDAWHGADATAPQTPQPSSAKDVIP